MTFTAPSRLRLDSSALIANWKTMARMSGAAAAGAAVKADAYGLGACEVVPKLWEAGCRDFFVAHWSEAAAIAKLVPPRNIAVLNGISSEDMAAAREIGAIPVLNTAKQILAWKAGGGGRCHLMLDSGINRLGLGPEQIDAQLLEGLEIDILMSHLASADEDVDQNRRQLEMFHQASQNISARRKSLANSAGIALGKDYCFDLTRPGLAVYGGVPRNELSSEIKQVVWPEARILQIRQLDAGSPIGYNATFTTRERSVLATISVGYADGYFRGFSNAGFCRLGVDRFPVVGRVSMDLVTVDISNSSSQLAEGDWLAVEFELNGAAATSGISQYELLTGLGRRYSRHWI